MAGEKEMACCARGYHVYKGIWAAAIREVLVCSTEPTIRVTYFRTFSAYENIFTTKIKWIMVLTWIWVWFRNNCSEGLAQKEWSRRSTLFLWILRNFLVSHLPGSVWLEYNNSYSSSENSYGSGSQKRPCEHSRRSQKTCKCTGLQFTQGS